MKYLVLILSNGQLSVPKIVVAPQSEKNKYFNSNVVIKAENLTLEEAKKEASKIAQEFIREISENKHSILSIKDPESGPGGSGDNENCLSF